MPTLITPETEKCPDPLGPSLSVLQLGNRFPSVYMTVSIINWKSLKSRPEPQSWKVGGEKAILHRPKALLAASGCFPARAQLLSSAHSGLGSSDMRCEDRWLAAVRAHGSDPQPWPR